MQSHVFVSLLLSTKAGMLHMSFVTWILAIYILLAIVITLGCRLCVLRDAAGRSSFHCCSFSNGLLNGNVTVRLGFNAPLVHLVCNQYLVWNNGKLLGLATRQGYCKHGLRVSEVIVSVLCLVISNDGPVFCFHDCQTGLPQWWSVSMRKCWHACDESNMGFAPVVSLRCWLLFYSCW